MLLGDGVADRVREIDRRRAGLDRGTADLRHERRVRAGRVLARELDLVNAPHDVGEREASLLDDFGRLESELELHVDGARREEDVDARAAASDGESLDGGVEVFPARSCERRDGRTRDGGTDGSDALE